MIIEIDELNFDGHSPAQLAAVRPEMARLANIMRRNLHLLDTVLGVGGEQRDLAREYDLLRAEACEIQARVEALEHDLATARAWIGHLEAKLAAIEDDEEEDALYRSVGLAPCAHTVVIAAARRALLQHYHPDRWDQRQKSGATAKFQATSATFEKIARLRG